MNRFRLPRHARAAAAPLRRCALLAVALMAAVLAVGAAEEATSQLTVEAADALRVAVPHPVTLTAEWDAAAFEFLRVDLDLARRADPASTWTLTLSEAPRTRSGRLDATLLLTGFEFGEAHLEGVSLALRGRSDRSIATVPVAAVSVAFVPTIDATAAPEPAKIDPIDAPPTFLEAHGRRIGWTLVALAAGLLLALLLRRLFAPKPERYIPEDEWALGELDALRAHPLETQQDIESFHFRLAEVLRLYCGRRWVFLSAKMTTFELEHALRAFAPDLADAQRASLLLLLEEADMVKFARESASKLTCADRIAQAVAFVKVTRFALRAGGTAPHAPASASADPPRRKEAA